jgi:rubrerythrin
MSIGDIMDKKELEAILKESLAIEHKGHKWYSDGAEKIKNSLGRRMLLRLAEDELIHIKRIRNIYESLTNGKLDEVELDTPNLAIFDEIFERMKGQMDEAVEDLTEVGVDDEEIISVALDLESHSRFYYEEAAQKASEKVIKEFYELLAKEEKYHYDLLQKTNQYMANPSLFFGMSDH